MAQRTLCSGLQEGQLIRQMDQLIHFLLLVAGQRAFAISRKQLIQTRLPPSEPTSHQ
jgi:hypothetical protein